MTVETVTIKTRLPCSGHRLPQLVTAHCKVTTQFPLRADRPERLRRHRLLRNPLYLSLSLPADLHLLLSLVGFFVKVL